MPETMSEASLDQAGKAIPLEPIEARIRADRGSQALAAAGEIGDENEQRATLEALLEALDEARPPAQEHSA